METQEFNKIKKTLAILLAVSFLVTVTVTVTTVSAYTTIGGETNDKNTIVIHYDKHRFGDHDDKFRKDRYDNCRVRPQINLQASRVLQPTLCRPRAL